MTEEERAQLFNELVTTSNPTAEDLAARAVNLKQQNAIVDANIEKNPAVKAAVSVGKDLLDQQLEPVKAVYLDLQLILDIKIGAVLSQVTDEETYNYFYKQLTESYDNRKNTFVSKHFPELFKNEEEFEKIIADRSNHGVISKLAPPTRSMNNFDVFVDAINNASKITGKKMKEWSLYINTYPLHLDPVTKENIEGFLQHYDLRMRIEFIREKQSDLSVELMDTCRFFYFYDAQEWCGVEGTSRKHVIDDGAFITSNKFVFGCNHLPDGLDYLGQNELDTLEFTLKTMNSYMDFTFIPVPKLFKQ